MRHHFFENGMFLHIITALYYLSLVIPLNFSLLSFFVLLAYATMSVCDSNLL